MLKPVPEKPQFPNSEAGFTRRPVYNAPGIPIIALGMSLGIFLSVTFLLCVLFDLWLPAYAMNPAWVALLPGFTWISWPSLFLGLVETFAYGWYVALFFGGIYNFTVSRSVSRKAV
jgi:uncharacterized protein DUF5676